MPYFVWCKKEDCRIPSFRCLLCGDACYPGRHTREEADDELEMLVKSGRYKERFVMKRKENVAEKEVPRAPEDKEGKREDKSDSIVEMSKESGSPEEQRIFLMEDGKLEPFSSEEYTASTLYQVVESFSVECRLVRPEDPGNLVFEGKRPAKKTIPIIVTKGGDSLLLESWESLEAKPEQLANAAEVIGAMPVKQVFVLKRK